MKRPPLDQKDLLNLGETVELYDLKRDKLLELLNSSECLPFILIYRKRRMIVRQQFDIYLNTHPEWEEELKRAKRQ
jgi:hypothetical protein